MKLTKKKKINSFNDRVERDVIKTEMRTLNETYEKQSTENGKKLNDQNRRHRRASSKFSRCYCQTNR
jgi:hypothetical protein